MFQKFFQERQQQCADGCIVLMRRKRMMKECAILCGKMFERVFRRSICVYLNLSWQGHFKLKEFSSYSVMHGNDSSNDIWAMFFVRFHKFTWRSFSCNLFLLSFVWFALFQWYFLFGETIISFSFTIFLICSSDSAE